MYMVLFKLGDKRAPRVAVVEDLMQRGVVYCFPRGRNGAAGEVGALQAATFRKAFVNCVDGAVKEYRLEAEVITPDGRFINRMLDSFHDHDDSMEALASINAAMSRRARKGAGGVGVALALTALVAGGLFFAGGMRAMQIADVQAAQSGYAAPLAAQAPNEAQFASNDAWRQGSGMSPLDANIAAINSAEQSPWGDMKGIFELNQFKVGKDKEPSFYLFTDPRCPACAEQEKVLAQTSDVTYSIVPLGAQTPEAAVLVAQVFCADDQPGAWGKVMNGEQVPPQGKSKAQLRECTEKTLVNLKYFLDNQPGGRAATPTFVRADGKVKVGGFSNPQSLKDWLRS